MMLELVRQLFAQPSDRWKDVLPILRVILHSPALTEAVRATKSPVDDLLLRVLRALVPSE
jgi:hypothetical protein